MPTPLLLARAQDDNDIASPRRLAASADGRLVCAAARDRRVRVGAVEIRAAGQGRYPLIPR